jgi:MFS family permease
MLTATFLAVLSSTIVTVAVPTIRAELGTGPTATVWILGAYALAYGAVLIVGGRIGDVAGRRPIFLVGLSVFTAGAALAAAAWSPIVLIIATSVQGVGAGVCIPQVLGTIATAVPGSERGRAFGLYGVSTGLGAAAGPLLGGVLLAADPLGLSWRSVFVVIVVLGVAALAVGGWALPSSRGEGAGVDVVGAVLLIVALVLLLTPLTSFQQASVNPIDMIEAVLGVLTLAVFGLTQLRRTRQEQVPLFDLRLLRVPSFSLAAVIGLLYFTVFQALLFCTSLHTQDDLAGTAFQAGLALTPFAIAAVVASLASDRVTRRLGPPVVILGAGLVAAGLGLAVLVTTRQWGIGSLAGALLVVGLGHGLIVPPNVSLGMRDVPATIAGGGGGVITTAQRLGQSLGVSLLGAVFLQAPDGYQVILYAALALTVLVALAGLTIPRHRHPRAPDYGIR